MSHHSIRSWNMYVSKTVRAEIEEIRKRVGIAHRLATSAQSQDVESPSKRPKLNNPTNGPDHATAPPPQTLTTEQEDLDVICNFFASGRGNDEDDELVWENLTKHVSLQSAPLSTYSDLKWCRNAARLSPSGLNSTSSAKN